MGGSCRSSGVFNKWKKSVIKWNIFVRHLNYDISDVGNDNIKMVLNDPTVAMSTEIRSRRHWRNLVTAILMLLVTEGECSYYQLVMTDSVHRITWSVYWFVRHSQLLCPNVTEMPTNQTEQNAKLLCVLIRLGSLLCYQKTRHRQPSEFYKPPTYNATCSRWLRFVAVWHGDTLESDTGTVLDLREQLWPWLCG